MTAYDVDPHRCRDCHRPISIRQFEEQEKRCSTCWPPVALVDVWARLPEDARQPIARVTRRGDPI